MQHYEHERRNTLQDCRDMHLYAFAATACFVRCLKVRNAASLNYKFCLRLIPDEAGQAHLSITFEFISSKSSFISA